MTHYDTLQVVPWAEDSVIRAAYRALMRVYHPDTNKDPEAEFRVREITAAFAVLGDPAKRAAYDAFPTLDKEAEIHQPDSFAAHQRPRPSIRSVGVVSVGVAVVVLSLAISMWPQSGMGPRQQGLWNPLGNARRVAPPLKSVPTSSSVVIGLKRSPAVPAKHPASTETLEREVTGMPLSGSAVTIPIRDVAQRASSKSKVPISISKPAAEEIMLPKAGSDDPTPNATSRSPAVASYSRDSSKTSAGASTDDRQAQVERIAAIFFRQSMEHADSHKQELLLSAQTRSAFSRTLCRSSDCVTRTYLRQMRDTTEIMQGRVPTPR